jgi:hypothetical protein
MRRFEADAAAERIRATPTRHSSGQKRGAMKSVSPIDRDDKHRHKRPQQAADNEQPIAGESELGKFTLEEAYLAIPESEEERQLEAITRRWPNSAKKYDGWNWKHNRRMRRYHDPVVIVNDLQRSEAKGRSGHGSWRKTLASAKGIVVWRGSTKRW